MNQPIKTYKILVETHPSGLLTTRMKTLRFTGTRQEAAIHLSQYLANRNLSNYKAYLQEIV